MYNGLLNESQASLKIIRSCITAPLNSHLFKHFATAKMCGELLICYVEIYTDDSNNFVHIKLTLAEGYW